MTKITLREVADAVRAFEDSKLSKMSNAWDELREKAILAIARYEQENGLSTLQVLQKLKEIE